MTPLPDPPTHPPTDPWMICREPADGLNAMRVTLGRTPAGRYLVFRGDPLAIVELLEDAARVARVQLPDGEYVGMHGG